VTSQLPIEHWHAAIGDATLADAILDRLVHSKCQRNPYPARSLQIDDLTQQPRRDTPLFAVTQQRT
jgi:hypothetical protein